MRDAEGDVLEVVFSNSFEPDFFLLHAGKITKIYRPVQWQYPCFVTNTSIDYPCSVTNIDNRHPCFVTSLSPIHLCFVTIIPQIYPCFVTEITLLYPCFITCNPGIYLDYSTKWDLVGWQ